MGKVIMSGIVPPLVVPVTGIKLGDIAEGSIVKLNESGSPVEFYVAKHDYESGLNGTGRTLLVRKDCYNARRFHSSNITNGRYGNDYSTSEIDSWLDSSYKSILDSTVQNIISATKIYYTVSDDNTLVSSINTIQRSIFLLSLIELGRTPDSEKYLNEGSTLPIYNILKQSYLNGSPIAQWTRTIRIDYEYGNGVWTINGAILGTDSGTGSLGCRPCFTLPETALFDENTLQFKGVV